MDWPVIMCGFIAYGAFGTMTFAMCGDEAEAIWWPVTWLKYLFKTFITVAFTGWR